MTKSELNPNTFKDMNKEFQYLWNKYGRDDWHAENLGDYCANLEYMIMNYLDRNKELGPIKSTASEDEKDNSKEDELDAPAVFFENYDYGQQTKSEKENTKQGPGTGMYENLDKYKSVKDFINTDRKMKRKQRKKKLAHLLYSLASGIIGDVEIPKEVLEKIKKDKEEDEEEPKEESEEITQDNTITGIPFANRVDSGPSYDELLTYPNGALFDNDTMKNSYYGIYSLQGSSINKALKIAEMYYNLTIDSNNKI